MADPRIRFCHRCSKMYEPAKGHDCVPPKVKPERPVVPTVAAVIADPELKWKTVDRDTKPKTDRKEYLKLKARERRAAEKLGLSVAEYRAKQKAGEK